MPFDHPAFVQTADGKGIPYVHVPRQEKNGREPYRLPAEKSLSYFEELKKKGGNVYVDTLTYEEFGLLTELDVKKRFSEIKNKPVWMEIYVRFRYNISRQAYFENGIALLIMFSALQCLLRFFCF